MKPLKSERGYALLLTLGLMILFTVLGLSMLSLTSSGMKKNEIRKEIVQATAQAEKGIDWTVADINYELTKFLGKEGKSSILFAAELERVLNNEYPSCLSKGETNNQETPIEKYEVCIRDHNPINDTRSRRLVKFESTGYAGNIKNKKIYKDIEIGAEAYPINLKYVLSTNAKPENSMPNQDLSEGNLMLHGGPDIYGDIKVDKDLFMYNRAINNQYTIMDEQDDTPYYNYKTLPKSFSGNNSPTAKLYLAGEMYTTGNYPFYDNKPKRTEKIAKNNYMNYLNDPYGKKPSGLGSGLINEDQKNNLNTMFLLSHTPTQTKIKQEDSFIDIESQFDSNNLPINKLIGNQNIESGVHDYKNGLYVDGNLLIGNRDNKKSVTLKGKIYVNGNVEILNTDLDSDLIMYVKGKVDIRTTKIETTKQKKGTLFIFSTGAITMSDISAGLPKNFDVPSILNGFFYSQDNFEVHAVGSHININGGISARRIVLNAIRGQYNTKKTSDSRLQIRYNKEIIDNFLALNNSFSIITKIDSPKEVNRENK